MQSPGERVDAFLFLPAFAASSMRTRILENRMRFPAQGPEIKCELRHTARDRLRLPRTGLRPLLLVHEFPAVVPTGLAFMSNDAKRLTSCPINQPSDPDPLCVRGLGSAGPCMYWPPTTVQLVSQPAAKSNIDVHIARRHAYKTQAITRTKMDNMSKRLDPQIISG